MGDMSGSSGNLGLGGLAAGAGGIGAAGSSGAGSTGGGGPCGACRFLRRKCVTGCIFAPYFHSEQGAICFAAVHKVFGASNVSKLLARTPTHKRRDAVLTICYEAQFRIRNPVYGCVSQILSLQQQVMNLQNKVSYLQAHIATLELQAPSPPPPPPAPAVLLPPTPPTLSISDLPSATTLPATFNLEGIMDTPAWSLLQQDEQSEDQQDRHEQQLLELQQLVDGVGGGSFITENASEDGDLQSPTDELIERMQE